jgi:sterol desaturase/sphingolipid hydroxylase (fatty acid hydroxylase superfamily)
LKNETVIGSSFTKDIVMKKNYVSNSEESVRMFKASWMEALSKVHWTVPLFLYIPVIIWSCYKAYTFNTPLLTFFGLLVLGIAVWTFTEYIMHRFVFHTELKGKIGERIHFIFHGVHHDYPSDRLRLVLPPSVSIPLAFGFFFLFSWLLPAGNVYSFFPGFLMGYLVYDITHYAIHHFNFKSGLWKRIKKHHMLHHYSDPHKGYGVSSSLWDKVFRSDFIKK